MKKKYAFILMGGHYTPAVHQSVYEADNQITYICTVRNYEEAIEKVDMLVLEGVGAIELCGAFGVEKAKEIMNRTNHKVVIGYVVNDPTQEELVQDFFKKF